MSGAAHEARAAAECFGDDPERYDRARPGYPDDMVARIVAESPGPKFLDVGIGTGLAARQFEATGCRVTGVDVDPRMAELARRRGFDVDVARFEEWDPAGRCFDAVIAGQAWHWVDPVLGAAKAAAVLRPGGRLAVFWNVFQPPPEVARVLGDVYRSVLAGALGDVWSRPVLKAYENIFRTTEDGIRLTGSFNELGQWRFVWRRSYTRDEWLDQVPTFGGAGQLPAGTMNDLLSGIGRALDALGGGFTMDYTSVAVTAVRHGS